MNSTQTTQDGDPFITAVFRVLEYLPPQALDHALTEIHGILTDCGKLEEQYQSTHAHLSFEHLLASSSKEHRQLVHRIARHRFYHWIRSHFDERIEIEQVRAKIENSEKQFRDLEDTMVKLRTTMEQLSELAKERGLPPIELNNFQPEPGSKSSSSELRERKAPDPMETLTVMEHRSYRRMINPWRILWSSYRFEIRRLVRSLARGATTLLAGMAIFVLAGLVHHLETPSWYLAFIAVPLVVAAIELLAHRWVEGQLQIWERRDMSELPCAFAKIRIAAVVDNAIADWAIEDPGLENRNDSNIS